MAEPGTTGAENEPEADNALLVDRRAYLAFADPPKKDKQVETRSGISNDPALICEAPRLEHPTDDFARCRNESERAHSSSQHDRLHVSVHKTFVALIKDG